MGTPPEQFPFIIISLSLALQTLHSRTFRDQVSMEFSIGDTPSFQSHMTCLLPVPTSSRLNVMHTILIERLPNLGAL